MNEFASVMKRNEEKKLLYKKKDISGGSRLSMNECEK